MTATIAGISHHPPDGKGWWDISGSPVRLPNVIENSYVSDDGGKLVVRGFVLRLLNAEPNAEMVYDFTPASGWAGGSNGDETQIVAAIYPKSPLAVRVGVATSPWNMLEDLKIDQLPGQMKSWPIHAAKPIADQGGVSITVRMQSLPSNARLVLVDRAGKVHINNSMSGSGSDEVAPWGAPLTTYSFQSLHIADIAALRLVVRTEEYARFENVPLEPKP